MGVRDMPQSRLMSWTAVMLTVALPGTCAIAAALETPPPAIAHDPLRCVQASEFPRVSAGVSSTVGVRGARVYFRAHGYPDWYYVDMRVLEGTRYLALLPRPLPETKQLDYYVHALDAQVQMSQTDTYDPEVTRGQCALRKKLPIWKGPMEILLHGTKELQAPIPPGFSSQGIVGFVTPAGQTITGSAFPGGGAPAAPTASAAPAASGGSATALAAGGGISATMIVVGATLAAGAGVAGVAAASSGGGGEDKKNDQEKPDTGPAPTLTLTMTPDGAAMASVTQVRFTATTTGLDTATITYQWDFGDGTTSAEAQPTHTFATAGAPQVQLTVRDARAKTATGKVAMVVKDLAGRWEQNRGGVPSHLNCVHNAAAWSCTNPVFDISDGTANVMQLFGTLSSPRTFSGTIRNEDLFYGKPYDETTCGGDFDANLNTLVCCCPWGIPYTFTREQ
jgi:PKD repeat protein